MLVTDKVQNSSPQNTFSWYPPKKKKRAILILIHSPWSTPENLVRTASQAPHFVGKEERNIFLSEDAGRIWTYPCPVILLWLSTLSQILAWKHASPLISQGLCFLGRSVSQNTNQCFFLLTCLCFMGLGHEHKWKVKIFLFSCIMCMPSYVLTWLSL